MKIDKILAITIISLLVMSVGTVNGDVFNTLKLKQDSRPSVCMFEPAPGTTDNWDILKTSAFLGVYEWELKMQQAYPDGDWEMEIHPIIPWEEHEHKFVEDYKQCNIMINFEKTHPNENSTAIGTTSIQFQNSAHKFMFINIYLEHPTTSKNVKIVIGGEEQGTFTVSTKTMTLSPLQVRNVVLHEVGHALGLAHYDLTNSLKTGEHGMDRSSMYYSMNLNDKEQLLEVKRPEILMLKEIYGEDGWLGSSPAWIIKSCTLINNLLFGCE